MSLLGRFRQARQAAKTRRKQRLHDSSMQEWEAERAELEGFLAEARTFNGETDDGLDRLHVSLRKGERIFLVAQRAVLIEPKRQRGHYQGGYAGTSFRIAKGVRLSTGGFRGRYVPGEEKPVAIEEGTVIITNQRVTFHGQQKSREWAFSKLIAVEHHPTLPWTSLPVSNRQTVSGFLYDEANADAIRFRLELALAHFNDSVAGLISRLERELQDHHGQEPAALEG